MMNHSYRVIGTLEKMDGRYVPLHPDYLSRLDKSLSDHFIFESGNGATFGITDTEIVAMSGGLASRQEILSIVGSVIAFKPMLTLGACAT
jgi:N5-(carboxyethyl)ornithine synthase